MSEIVSKPVIKETNIYAVVGEETVRLHDTDMPKIELTVDYKPKEHPAFGKIEEGYVTDDGTVARLKPPLMQSLYTDLFVSLSNVVNAGLPRSREEGEENYVRKQYATEIAAVRNATAFRFLRYEPVVVKR